MVSSNTEFCPYSFSFVRSTLTSFLPRSGSGIGVGVAVGSADGSSVGVAVGVTDGSVVDVAVGVAVGSFTGSFVGPFVGPFVGLFVVLAGSAVTTTFFALLTFTVSVFFTFFFPFFI